MRLEFSVEDRHGIRHDLVVHADPRQSVGEVLAPFLRIPSEPAFLGPRLLEPDLPLAAAIVHNGARIRIGNPGPDDRWTGAPLLVTEGGADAGRWHPIERTTTIGRATSNDFVIADPTVSGQHATLTREAEGYLLTDLGSANGTFVRGRRLSPNQPVPLADGERFLLGQASCRVQPATDPDGSVEPGEGGEMRFNRVLRYAEPAPPEPIRVPTAERHVRSAPLWPQIVSSVAVLAGGVLWALISGNWVYAAVGALGPVAILGTTIAVGRQTKHEDSARRREIETGRAEAAKAIESAAARELAAARAATLDPATAHLAATGPLSLLWSVDPMDARALVARVGTQDRRATTEVQADSQDPLGPHLLHAAPVTVDLRAASVLGIAGPAAELTGAARCLVHQLVTTRSPDDLWVYYLSSGTGDGWSWLRWLPHVRALHPELHQVGTQPATVKQRLDELIALIDQRTSQLEWQSNGLVLPEILVILDGAGALRSRAAVVKVLQKGPAVGVRVIALDDQSARLPVEASARLLLRGSESSLEVRDEATQTGITPDLLAHTLADRSARALAPLVPLGGGTETNLPTLVPFLELAQLDQRGPGGQSAQGRASDVLTRWATGAEGTAMVGVDEHDNPVAIDLVGEGPHALVAGSTGSGKSEFLRTWIAGLALSASPEDLTFLLIDFKGGGAFGKLLDLPHLVGYADDLTIAGPLAQRLLDSLTAELDHRKARFKEAGNVSDLIDYRAARAVDPLLPLIPRLVIVVDEFAQLKEAQPDFIDGLVNVARVGRSLGVHLILATQQPEGVVTGHIRDNANLRICLRVIDPGTSLDLVGSSVAASFPTQLRGRAVFATGDHGSATVFQSAYVSGSSQQEDISEIPPTQLRALPWSRCGEPPGTETRAEQRDSGTSDLARLVDLLTDAAVQGTFSPPRRPWLAPLPESVPLSGLLAARTQAGVPFGLQDQPSAQRQLPLELTLGHGNIGIAGGRASGRTSALRTIAAALALTHSADDVHLHVLDYSAAPGLRTLGRLPHCGVSATRADRYVTERLLQRLLAECAHRAGLMAQTGATDLAELRGTRLGHELPHIVVLVDGWDTIAGHYDGEGGLRDCLMQLLADGPPLGIQFVVAGGRGVGSTQVATHLEDLLVLRFDQRDELHTLGLPMSGIPDRLPAGRAYRPGSADAIQLALLEAGADAGADELIRRMAHGLAPARNRPWTFVELPVRITLDEISRLHPPPATSGTIVLGVGGDALEPRTVDVTGLRTALVITGPPQSGRSSALALVACQLLAAGVPVVAYNLDNGHLPEVRRLSTDDEIPADAVVLVDDADRLAGDDPVLTAALSRTLPKTLLTLPRDGAPGGFGWMTKVRSGCTGVLLSPGQFDGDHADVSIERAEAFNGPPGRGFLVERGTKNLVHLPVVD